MYLMMLDELFEQLQERTNEEAVSKKQQRFMGAVLNAKRTGNASTPEVAKAACGMKTKDVKDFASTSIKVYLRRKLRRRNSK